jgi:hypothetical protein
MRLNLWTGPLAAVGIALAVIAVMAGAPASSAEPPRGEKAITCMNKSSGTTWQINVDYDHDTVDTNPATITDATGDLTVVFASSMGGNMYFHRCLLDH